VVKWGEMGDDILFTFLFSLLLYHLLVRISELVDPNIILVHLSNYCPPNASVELLIHHSQPCMLTLLILLLRATNFNSVQ